VNLLIAPLIINEVFPNPSSGSEWVEILCLEENQFSPEEYAHFTISDDKRIIYQFSGDEEWLEKLLVIELSGLNNDDDSVILKNPDGLIVDEMSYGSSQKDLSWLRTDIENPLFILGEPSPLSLNSIPSPSAEPTPNPSHKPTPNPNHAITTNITPTSFPISSVNNNQEKTEQSTSKEKEKLNRIIGKQDILEKYFANYQKFKNLKIECQNSQHFPKSRLVFLGQKILKKAVVNAIIGSSLLILAAILLSYEQKKPKH
jgi:hypothetical protein